MISIRKAGAAALASTMLLVLPATALANGGHDDGPMGDRGDRGAGRGHDGVPSRIANKLRSAERAMDRAQDHADDAEPEAAVAALGAVTRHLTSARPGRSAAGSPPATPPGLPPRRRSRARRATSSTASSASSTARPTLTAALDGRDALVAGILALTDHSLYGWALGIVARDAASEAQDIAETLTDDTLTAAAKAALTAAQAQATATAAAARAGAGNSGPTSGQSGTPGPGHGNVADDGGQRDCPPGRERRQGGDEGGTPEVAAAPAAA